jgi:hypothetical protein
MSQQHPVTGMFTYMTPLMSGAAREFSKPTEDFWCCVGSGMESHAKHGESIYWEGDGSLLVNLYIPSRAHWRARGAMLSLDTGYPLNGSATLRLEELAKSARFAIALRVPGWATGAEITVNGKPFDAPRESGYAVVTRRWKAGDTLAIELPLALRIESTPDDPDTISILRGPLVLAADLGAGPANLTAVAPALVGRDVLASFSHAGAPAQYTVPEGAARPGALTFSPFYSLYERRTAVYFRRFTDEGWRVEQTEFLAEQARQRDLAARSVDVMALGETQAEADHKLASAISYAVSYRGLTGRDARSEGFFEFDLEVKPGVTLQATYWGDERPRQFEIFIDGQRLAQQGLAFDHPGKFFDVAYPIPEAMIRGKNTVRVRFAPLPRNTAGPVFGVRTFTQ